MTHRLVENLVDQGEASSNRHPRQLIAGFLLKSNRFIRPRFQKIGDRHAKQSIKETRLDIHTGSRPQVARATENTRSFNCAALEEI
jgi:hypothetical protein